MTKLTRRGLAKSAALAAGGLALHVDAADGPRRRPRTAWKPEDDDDIALVNGNFITLADDRGPVLVGGDPRRPDRRGRPRPNVRGCKRTIDLRGATVIPGLIDSHQHFIRGCHNPGYETRAIEAATSVAELQQAVAARARTAPAGAFLTCIGGWNRNGLAEKRLPTPAELDAAAPLHGVYLSETGGGGQAVTNTVGGAFFASPASPSTRRRACSPRRRPRRAGRGPDDGRQAPWHRRGHRARAPGSG